MLVQGEAATLRPDTVLEQKAVLTQRRPPAWFEPSLFLSSWAVRCGGTEGDEHVHGNGQLYEDGVIR